MENIVTTKIKYLPTNFNVICPYFDKLSKVNGVNGRASKEKELFLNIFFQRSKISTAIKLEGRGGLGLNGPAIKRRTFFAASLMSLSYGYM